MATAVQVGTVGNARARSASGPERSTRSGRSQEYKLWRALPLAVRAEIFNVFNHAQFLAADGNVTDGSDFGRVKRARDSELIQFALEVLFLKRIKRSQLGGAARRAAPSHVRKR